MKHHKGILGLAFKMLWLALLSWLSAAVCSAGTLGVTSDGTSSGAWQANCSHGNTHTSSAGFYGDTFHCYLYDVNGGHARAAVYATAGGLPTTLLSDTALVPLTSDGWYEFPLTSPVTIQPGVTYYLCIAADIEHGCRYTQAVSSSTYWQWVDASLTYPATYSPTAFAPLDTQCMFLDGPDQSPTVSPTLTATRTASPTPTISATYTVTPTITMTPTITPTPTISATYTVTPTVTPTPTITLTPTAIVRPGEVIAYPNPGKVRVTFLVNLAEAGPATLTLYNLAGEQAAQVEAILAAGEGKLVWDCAGVAPGLYLARVRTGSQEKVLKIAVIK